jgi:NAD-dependent dihydropyrimidine dehydrogenase PreA subunit
MRREIIKIDEEKCNGCGVCIPNCHEGALQIIDGKARLISDLMCDGLGACVGHCPEDAITMEEREAEPYNEKLVMEEMMPKGKNTIIAHLKHLKDYNEFVFLKEGIEYLLEHRNEAGFDIDEVLEAVHNHKPGKAKQAEPRPAESCGSNNGGGGCPGSMAMTINKPANNESSVAATDAPSELRQWPVQMHLINPAAGYFKNSDLLVAADCVAFSMGNFHSNHLKGKTVAIACPKLDSNMEVYVNKITALIDEAKINTITVMMMEVPCCGGLLRLVKAGADKASRKVPVKLMVVGIDGTVQKEEWV